MDWTNSVAMLIIGGFVGSLIKSLFDRNSEKRGEARLAKIEAIKHGTPCEELKLLKASVQVIVREKLELEARIKQQERAQQAIEVCIAKMTATLESINSKQDDLMKLIREEGKHGNTISGN